MAWCERQHIGCIVGLARNSELGAMLACHVGR
jgi:hypothetical protein